MPILAAFALAAATTWQDTLKHDLPLLGHRNWVCVVDSAYPAQVAPGVKLIDTGQDHITVLNAVLKAVTSAPHVRPTIFIDRELPYVAETDAPGITRLRKALEGALHPPVMMRAIRPASVAVEAYPEPPAKLDVTAMLHEEIISKLDQAGSTFHVLMLKTTCTLPYTSVFMQLNCGYWSDAAEKRMRDKMASGAGPDAKIEFRDSKKGG